MSDKEVYYIEIICIIFLLGFIVFFYYMAIANNEYKKAPELEKPVKKLPEKSYSEHEIKVRCPPKLVNLYDEQVDILPNKNDLNLINKSNISLHSSKDEINNVNFSNEIIRLNDIKTKDHRTFDTELDKVYTTDLVENTDHNYDYNQIFDYSSKPHKDDLPIANIPLCTLKDSSKSLKLSERFNE